MSPILFYFFAALTLLFGVAVVANRNPVASAMCLVVTFLGLAALFIGLNAYFIAAVQVLVYVGAVMVLFLFIIMLLDLRAEVRRKIHWPAFIGGCVIAGILAVQIIKVLRDFPAGNHAFPMLSSDMGKSVDDVHNIGVTLFSVNNLPFQVIGVLVLVATIGVIVLSKRELK